MHQIIFVTIGVPFSSIPIMQKVFAFVDLKNGETPVQIARNIRYMASACLELYGWIKGPNFTPEELYYEIYGSVENQVPFAASNNSRFWKETSKV